jgi:hypothetical protein
MPRCSSRSRAAPRLGPRPQPANQSASQRTVTPNPDISFPELTTFRRPRPTANPPLPLSSGPGSPASAAIRSPAAPLSLTRRAACALGRRADLFPELGSKSNAHRDRHPSIVWQDRANAKRLSRRPIARRIRTVASSPDIASCQDGRTKLPNNWQVLAVGFGRPGGSGHVPSNA